MDIIKVCFLHHQMDWGRGWTPVDGDMEKLLSYLANDKVVSFCKLCDNERVQRSTDINIALNFRR